MPRAVRPLISSCCSAVKACSSTRRSQTFWPTSRASASAWALYKAFVAWTEASLGEVRVDYSPKSYIGIRRGRRVWAPLWPCKDGAFVYLPDPDGLHGSRVRAAFAHFSSFRTIGNAVDLPGALSLKRTSCQAR